MRTTSGRWMGKEVRNLLAVLGCLGVAACANTGGGNVTGAVDSGTQGTTDTGGGKDTTQTGNDTGGGGSDTSGSDTSSVGSEMTIAQIQDASKDCVDGGKAASHELKGVTIRNAIVVSPTRSVGNQKAVMIQDKAGGPWSGMLIVGTKSADVSSLKVGDVVTVTGDVKDFYCLTEMYVTLLEVMPVPAELPAVTTITMADIGEKTANADKEKWENVLVTLADVTVGDEALGTDNKPHGEIYVGKDGDQVRLFSAFGGVYLSIKNPDGSFTAKYPKGTKFGSVTGVIEYSYNFRLVLTKDPEGVVKP